jgi:hypothetical protein
VGLRDQREPTSDAEHVLAVFAAESRLGRKLTAGEKRIDIVGVDRDLKHGKQALVAAIQAEQRRAAEAAGRGETPVVHVTEAMLEALKDLYDAGADHAERELKAAGVSGGD